MDLTPQQKLSVLKPGSIWRRKHFGAWQRVYLESTHTKLLRESSGEVDIWTGFGFEHVKIPTFLKSYEFLGWARIKFPDITADKNLIPLLEDVSK